MRKLRHRDRSWAGVGGWNTSRGLHPDESLHSLHTCVCTNADVVSRKRLGRRAPPEGAAQASVRVTRSGRGQGARRGWGGAALGRGDTGRHYRLRVCRQADDVVALVSSKSQSREPGAPAWPRPELQALGGLCLPRGHQTDAPCPAPSLHPCRCPLTDPTGARTHGALHEWHRTRANPQRSAWLEP